MRSALYRQNASAIYWDFRFDKRFNQSLHCHDKCFAGENNTKMTCYGPFTHTLRCALLCCASENKKRFISAAQQRAAPGMCERPFSMCADWDAQP